MTMITTGDDLIRPPPLSPGDPIHIVSPAGPVTEANLDAGLALLRRWGLEPIVTDAVYARRPPYDYLAGDDEARHQAFLAAWNDPKSKAIMCSRGGYGTMRLLKRLPLKELVARPKLLIGFSDITALHLYLAGVGGLATLHGPVVKSLPLYDDDPHHTAEHLRQALFGSTPKPEPWTGLRCVRPGLARGPVIGGNLSLICALIGSPFCPPLEGAILIIEDIGEVDYRLDRLLMTLRLATSENLGGLVLGEFSDCHGVYVAKEVLDEFIFSLGEQFCCPVVMDAPVGHGRTNRPFPLGVEATLNAHEGRLSFATHAVHAPHS